jgi:hypothetical protein
MLKKGLIDEDQAKNSRNGIDVVIPNLQKKEKETYEETIKSLLLFQFFYQTIDSALNEKRINSEEAEILRREVENRYFDEKLSYDSLAGDIRAFLFQYLYGAIDSALNEKLIDEKKAKSLKQEVDRTFPAEKTLYDSFNKETIENTEAGISLLQIFKQLHAQIKKHFLKLAYAQTGGGTGGGGSLDVTKPYLGLDLSQPFGGLDFSKPFLGLFSGGGGSGMGGLTLDFSKPWGGLDFSKPFLGFFGGSGGGGFGGGGFGGGGFSGFGGGGGGFGGSMGGMGGMGGGGAAGECYREGSSMGSGFNFWAMCCDCGYYYVGKKLKYTTDCTNQNCVIKLGCKSSYVCSSGRPVIWDSQSMTCGCG